MSPDPAPPATVEKRTKISVVFFGSCRNAALVRRAERFGGLEIAMRSGAARVHNTLGNALMIEMRDLFLQNEVFK